jgi:hypothetical protein
MLGSGAAQLGMSRSLHYVLLAVLLIPVAFGCGRVLLPAYADGDDATTSAAPAGGRGWNRRVVALGAMGARPQRSPAR